MALGFQLTMDHMTTFVIKGSLEIMDMIVVLNCELEAASSVGSHSECTHIFNEDSASNFLY